TPRTQYSAAGKFRGVTKVTTTKEAKYLATLPLDELIDKLKVYEMVLENFGVVFKTSKEKVKSLALKAKVTREKTSDDSDNQKGIYEDEDEAKEFNLMQCYFESSSPRVIGLDVEINLVTRAIGLEKVVVIDLEIKVSKAQDLITFVTIAWKKVTLSVRVQSLRKTRISLEELGVIMKTEMNHKRTQYVS
nr:transposase, Ptta/En/Spm, transposase, Tnp1/En/Spm-like protein [Tanacetum cinerariifolium]